MIDTRCSIAPMRAAETATRNRLSRLCITARIECSNPSEYKAAATRNQITLISAMGYLFKYSYTLIFSHVNDDRIGRPVLCARPVVCAVHRGDAVRAGR